MLLQDFLKHLLQEAKRDREVTEEKLIEYTDTMVSQRKRGIAVHVVIVLGVVLVFIVLVVVVVPVKRIQLVGPE